MFIFNHREKSIVNVSILNWVMKLSLFMCFSFFLFLKHPWMIFHSIHLLFLFFGLDTYKHALRKVVCMFLFNFSPKLPMKLLNSKKIQEKCIFKWSAELNFKTFPFIVYHEATLQFPSWKWQYLGFHLQIVLWIPGSWDGFDFLKILVSFEQDCAACFNCQSLWSFLPDHSWEEPPFFKGGGVNFNYLPWGGDLKLKKGDVEVWYRVRKKSHFKLSKNEPKNIP